MKKKIVEYIFVFSVLFLGVLIATHADAQCSLCASNVKSAVHSNSVKAGLGLNTGIIMLLAMPYTIIMIFAGIWYFNRRQAAQK